MRKPGLSIALIALTLAIGIGGASWIFANGAKRPVNNLTDIADNAPAQSPNAKEKLDTPAFEFPVESNAPQDAKPLAAAEETSGVTPKIAAPSEQPRKPGPTPTTPKVAPADPKPTAEEEIRKAMEMMEQLIGKTVEFTVTVSGVVVDEFGVPAPGADIFARLEQKRPPATESGGPAKRVDLGSLLDRQSGVAIATADQAGRFSATFTRRVGENSTITLCLKAGGEIWLEDGETRHEVSNGDNLSGLTLKVKAAATLSGRVVDGSGIGVEKANVSVSVVSGATPDHSRGDDLRRRISSGGARNLAAVTDANGDFVLKGLAPGQYAVNVTKAGYRQAPDQKPQITLTGGRLETLPAPVVLNVAASVRISVTVEDGTKFSSMRAEFIQPAVGNRKAFSVTLSASAAKDGTFTFNNVPLESTSVIFSNGNRVYKPSDPIAVVVADGKVTDLGVINIYKDPDAKPYPSRGPGPNNRGSTPHRAGDGEDRGGN